MKKSFIASMLASTFFLCSITTMAAPIERSGDIPAPPANYKVSVKNTCFLKLSVFVMFGKKSGIWGNITWHMDGTGWHELNPGETKFIVTTEVNTVYYYAETLDGPPPSITWTGPSTGNGANVLAGNKSYNMKPHQITGGAGEKTIEISCTAEKTANELSKTNSKVSQGKAVGLYQNANYMGLSSALTAGNYDFDKLGISEDVLSSLRVPNGWSVTIYRDRAFTGSDNTYTADVPTFPTFYDDAVSSVVITGSGPVSGNAALGGATVSPYTVRIKNDCFKKVKVLLFKYTQASPTSTTGDFKMSGFFEIEPGGDYDAGMTTKEIVYYYAEMIGGPRRWDGKSQTPIGPSQTHNSKTYTLRDNKFKSTIGTQTLIIECNEDNSALSMGGGNGEGVKLWESEGYGGSKHVTLGAGEYKDLDQISVLGGLLGSIEVPLGWSITLYKYDMFVGGSKTFTTSQSSLGIDWKDKVYSFKIENSNKKEGNDSKKESNDITNKNKQVSPTGNDNTEAVSQNLAADQTYNIAVSKELTTEDAWERVKTVITPNGFFRDAIDNKFQTLTTLWKAFPRLNNTLRVKITIEKDRSGTENDNSYNLIFSAEESGEKGTSVHDNVKYRQTRMLPKECDKFIEDLRRKVGGN